MRCEFVRRETVAGSPRSRGAAVAMSAWWCAGLMAGGCDGGAIDPPPPPPPPVAVAPVPAPQPAFPSSPGNGSTARPTPPDEPGIVVVNPAPPASGPSAVGGETDGATEAEAEAADGVRTTRRPLAVGQWTRHRVTEASGRVSEMEYRVVAAEGGAHWVAMKLDQMEMKLLLALGPGPRDVDLRAVDIQGQRLEGPALAGVRQMVGDGLANAVGVGDWSGQERDRVTTAAGSFEAFKGRHQTTVGPMNAAGIAWHHPDVPISGLIRADNDDGGKIELIAYGE